MNLRRDALLPALLALAAAACGQSDPSPPAKPALWEIAGPQGTEGYLFGTIHALPDDARWDTPRMDAAFEDSDILVVEIADFDVAQVFARLATTRGSGPLSARVSPRLRGDMAALSDSLGGIEPRFVDMEDWAAALTLASLLSESDPENGVDRALIDRAGSAKPVRELEGAEAQLRMFDTMPAAQQRALLDSVVEDYADGATQDDELRDYWLAGDMEAIRRDLAKDIARHPELYRRLMSDRNIAMDRKLAPMLARAPKPFVAVGAAHMVGETGLPALLARRGYTVSRIQ